MTLNPHEAITKMTSEEYHAFMHGARQQQETKPKKIVIEDPTQFAFYIDGKIQTGDFDIVREWSEETEEPEFNYRAVHYSRVGWWQPAGPVPEEDVIPCRTE